MEISTYFASLFGAYGNGSLGIMSIAIIHFDIMAKIAMERNGNHGIMWADEGILKDYLSEVHHDN